MPGYENSMKKDVGIQEEKGWNMAVDACQKSNGCQQENVLDGKGTKVGEEKAAAFYH